MTDTHRPATSKPRGICKYYTTERGCFNAKSCKFLHTTELVSDPSGSRPPHLTPYDQSKRCIYFAQGYCKRGDKCWFIHETSTTDVPSDDDDDPCSVCFEKPSLYGLLMPLTLIKCIRKWRNPAGKDGDVTNIKKCPYCRSECRFIIPSSRFCKEGPEKERIIQNYKDSMKRVPCKHFVATKAKDPRAPMCPFGKDCFYQHLNDDGTPFIFSEGVDKWHLRNRPHGFFGFMSDEIEPLFFQARGNLAQDLARDMVDQMMAVVMESSAEGQGTDASRTESRRRARMVADAMSVIRAQLVGASDYDSEHVRVVPTIPPASTWDLDAEGEGADNGWGWTELVADAVHNADVDFAQHLESLADNMLGSIRIVRGRDTESGSPPPLEPINHQRADTPPPPLEPIGNETVGEDDEMPALQSVSNSSDDYTDSDDHSDDGEPDRYSEYDASDEPPPLEALDLAPNSTSSGFLTGMAQVSEASSRFSTIVEREDTRPATGLCVGQQPSSLESDTAPVRRTEEASASPSTTVVATDSQEESASSDVELAPEPPFVTDGRGRVVWSNKDSTDATPVGGREEHPNDASPSTASRLLEWMSGLF
ncbi:hypothetical protein H0H92_012782 [Tricholoma furcatifolium]|nr:hypothetical protein H0H92_012782 [Tricholoma furcatifolium]